MAETKIDERAARIKELQAEHDRRKANAEALRKQHLELMVALKEMDQLKAHQIEKTLDSLPDASPKGLIDKVLQIADPKRGQLLGNLDKLKIAVENETRKMRAAASKKKRLENEIADENLDRRVINLYRHFEEWADLYNECEDYFYKLVESIRLADLDSPGWHLRGQKLGLNPIILTCFDSYMKNLDNISMNEVVIRCSDFSTASGTPLFKKLAQRQQDIPMMREHF